MRVDPLMKLIDGLMREEVNIDLIMIFVDEIEGLFLSIDFNDGHPSIHIFFHMLILWLSFEMKLLLFGNMSHFLPLITVNLSLKLGLLMILFVESIDQIIDINFGFHCWLIIWYKRIPLSPIHLLQIGIEPSAYASVTS